MNARKFLALVSIGLFAVAVGALAGCSGGKTPPPKPASVMNNEFGNAPEWVTKGCNAYWDSDKGKKMICGVGSVGGTRNPSLARNAAIARGRTEIARKIQVKTTAMLKDYQATTTGGEEFGTGASDEQHIEDTGKQVTEMTLNGTEMVASWTSPNGTFYALVAMDVDKFKDAVGKMGKLSESTRKAIIERADKAFMELDTTIEEKNN